MKSVVVGEEHAGIKRNVMIYGLTRLFLGGDPFLLDNGVFCAAAMMCFLNNLRNVKTMSNGMKMKRLAKKALVNEWELICISCSYFLFT